MNVYEVGLKYRPSLSQTEVNCIEYRNSLHISCFQNVLVVIRLCWKKYQCHCSLPFLGDVIILRDCLITNGERETFVTSEFLPTTRSSKRLCRGAMLREFDHDR